MYRNTQSGAALFVALIILLVVSMMGVSAMKGGIFHERMAFNSQAEEMSFQAAETAIGGVIREARNSTVLLGQLAAGHEIKTHCVTMAAGTAEGACEADDTLDIRQSLQAEAQSRFDRQRPLMNSDAGLLADFQFHTIGKGSFVVSDMPFENRNRQEWRRVGPGGGHFAVDPDLLGLVPDPTP